MEAKEHCCNVPMVNFDYYKNFYIPFPQYLGLYIELERWFNTPTTEPVRNCRLLIGGYKFYNSSTAK